MDTFTKEIKKRLKDFANHLDELAEKEAETAFQSYKEQAIAKSGLEISNTSEIEPLLRQAFEKGIAPDRLAELLKQALKE